VLGTEAAVTSGPVSVQGEWITLSTTAPDGVTVPEVTLTSFYAYVSWFVTGENRVYKKGTFSRVKPASPYDGDGGKGALELAARFSSDDFDTVGDAKAVTVAANWYLNQSTRVMLNFVRSEGTNTPDLSGVITSILARFQIDF